MADGAPKGDLYKKDLKAASIHEAAHCVIVRHFGGDAYAHLYPTETADPVNVKTWVGHTKLYAEALDDRQRMLTGLAGFVADSIYEQGNAECDELLDALIRGAIELSENDRHLVGKTPSEADLVECIDLVKQHWGEIVDEAVNLVHEADDEMP